MNEVLTAAWWAVPLRVVVGYGFIAHGYAKLSKGPSGFAAILQALDVPVPDVMAWATILIELVGGVAVMLGAFVWIASIPLAVVHLVAMFTVHLPYGFSSIKLIAVTAAGAQFGSPGYEANLLYLASLAALVLGGSGPLSIDHLLDGHRASPPHTPGPTGPVRGEYARLVRPVLGGRLPMGPPSLHQP